jgi:hypothetical protein
MRKLEVRFLALLLLAAGMIPTAGAQASVGKMTLGSTQLKGTTALGGSSTIYSTKPTFSLKPDVDLVAARRNSVANLPAGKAAIAAALSIPSPKANAVSKATPQVAFKGLTTVDTANTNGFVVTPPDQGLCAGHGFVLESINLALSVYSQTGSQLTTPESVNSFFAADPATTFLSDPRCYYDAPTQRWFVSMIDVYNSANGRSELLLAVSQTSDPRGGYYLYTIDVTDDGANGTPSDPGCPCLGDQPLLGADKYGVYLSTNEFGLFDSAFNGAQIYAISKAALEAGTASSLVHFGNLPLAEGISYSVQPASSPDLNEEEGSGVEYFLSALDFYGTLDNRIAVWAVTNTRSLAQSTPSVSLTNVVIPSEAYGLPPSAPQKAGPYPLGQSLGEPEELLDSGDDRMQNVVFAGGHLWGGLDTIVSDGSNINAGIAYFDVRPSLTGSGLTATVQGQNYISVTGNSVIYPGIGVTADGAAAAALTLTGASYFPSAAYAKLNPSHAGNVTIVAAGTAPQDDFSGYPEYGGAGVARWGDYSWGVADGSALWLATEYIPGGIDSTYYLTDFGTFVFKVNPE